MLKDARYSFRVLLRNPLVASVAVLSLALGIGGAASVFTVLNAIVLRDLPVPNPQQLYTAEKHRADDVVTRYSWPLIEQARQEIQGRAELFAATPPTQMQVRLAARHRWRRSAAACSSSRASSSRRCASARRLGRLIEPRDNADAGASPVMVISDALLAAPLPARSRDHRPRAHRRRRQPHRDRRRRAGILRPVPGVPQSRRLDPADDAARHPLCVQRQHVGRRRRHQAVGDAGRHRVAVALRARAASADVRRRRRRR